MKPDKKKYNVCLMGASLETGNMGVSALAASLIKIVREVKPNSSISFLVGSRAPKVQELEISGQKIEIKVINHRLSPKAKVQENLLWILLIAFVQRILPSNHFRLRVINSNPTLTALREADFVGDIRGGDSFSDIYGLKKLAFGSLPAIIALLLNKKFVLLPQTYGPYKSYLAKHIGALVTKRSTHILSRDKESLETLGTILGRKINNKVVHFCPDVAFLLDSIHPRELNIYPAMNQNIDSPLIGFNVNGLLYHGGYTRDNMFGLRFDYRLFVHKLVSRLMEETEAHILLIPHTFGLPGNINSDPDACRYSMESSTDQYKDRLHMVNKKYDQHEIKGIIGLCDFFIGSRMHACIAAMSQGIPTVGVAYSKKFRGVFDSIGVGDKVIDARKVDLDIAIRRVLAFFENRDDLEIDIKEKIDIAKRKVRTTFQELLTH